MVHFDNSSLTQGADVAEAVVSQADAVKAVNGLSKKSFGVGETDFPPGVNGSGIYQEQGAGNNSERMIDRVCRVISGTKERLSANPVAAKIAQSRDVARQGRVVTPDQLDEGWAYIRSEEIELKRDEPLY